MNPVDEQRSKSRMVTFECPWCAEPASVDAVALDEISCEECGLRIELAPDPVPPRIAQAA